MDFFKSIIFSDDADPPTSSEDDEDGGAPDPQASAEEEEDEVPNPNPNPNPNPSGWSLGGIIKGLASKSESVIQTYRRDLEEFGSGIRKESAAIRDVAGGALDAGASVAQESLESVGQAIDDLGGVAWRGAAEIIAHGKEALRSVDLPYPDPDPDPDPDPNSDPDLDLDLDLDLDPEPFSSDPSSLSRPRRRPYSRFEAQVLAAQSDPETFLEEPDDAEDFERWRSEFAAADKEEEIEMLCYVNAALEGIHEKLVPEAMDRDAFWSRYFYKVHKLKQAEDARTKLVSRAISGGQDEDLSWDVDDDNDNKDGEDDVKEETTKKEEAEEEEEELELEFQGREEEEEEEEEETKKEVVLNSVSAGEKEPGEVSQPESFKDSEESADKERPPTAGKAENAESNAEKDEEMKTETADSYKNSDFSVISSQPSMPEDDLGWYEIEDLGEQDEKKPSSPPNVDLRKRLSAAADDEELSWDIEEDDEPTKR